MSLNDFILWVASEKVVGRIRIFVGQRLIKLFLVA